MPLNHLLSYCLSIPKPPCYTCLCYWSLLASENDISSLSAGCLSVFSNQWCQRAIGRQEGDEFASLWFAYCPFSTISPTVFHLSKNRYSIFHVFIFSTLPEPVSTARPQEFQNKMASAPSSELFRWSPSSCSTSNPSEV